MELKYFYFKKYPQDFIVEEKLKENPSGKGHVFYVMFEKKLTNTMDILKYLGKKLGLQRKHFGIGGLKDKEGITRQWISIYKRTLQSRGGESIFLSELSKVANILNVKRGNKLLKVGDIKGNLFFIRLRPKLEINQKFKKEIENVLKNIGNEGFPNYFGYQRFGKKNRNVKIGLKYLKGEIDIKDVFERKFKLQAVSSWFFNRYLDERINRGYFNEILDGDIVLFDDKNKSINYEIFEKGKQKLLIINKNKLELNESNQIIPTGPVVGYDLLLPPKGTIPCDLELDIFKKSGFKDGFLTKYKQNEIYGIRRNIKVYVKDLRYKRDNNDLLLMFELPPGSYASVFIQWLEKLV